LNRRPTVSEFEPIAHFQVASAERLFAAPSGAVAYQNTSLANGWFEPYRDGAPFQKTRSQYGEHAISTQFQNVSSNSSFTLPLNFIVEMNFNSPIF
jgi:hypothetical protein